MNLATKRDLCKKIRVAAECYEQYLEAFGNECAYTDRVLEQIVELAGKLEEYVPVLDSVMEEE